jgi:hypothetical protein
MTKDCPQCKLVNPPTAARCDCGYDFATNTMQESYLGGKRPPNESLGVGEIFICVLIPLVGLIWGFQKRRHGQHTAGNMMMLISGAMLVFYVALRLIVTATQSGN